jgi:probable AcnD-accessory protein PrpF
VRAPEEVTVTEKPLAQRAIPAVFMRGGTSKGVFFRSDSLPPPGVERDRILLRVLGSPDPYGKQIDGMGGASSSTSKVIIVGPPSRAGVDIDYCFGQVSIDAPLIDWSGNCGNLTAAVAPFAMHTGLLPIPSKDGIAHIKLWQSGIRKQIDVHVPITDGQVQELGDFELDGVTFPAAEIAIDFLDPGGSGEAALLPTGNVKDILEIPGLGSFEASLVNAGNPAVIIEARSIGLRGNELQRDINSNIELLARCETIRAHGAVAMKLAKTVEDATRSRPATPKLALVAPPMAYVASSGKAISPDMVDLNVRMLSMGVLHHALPGTGAITIGVAGALPGTLVHGVAQASYSPNGALRIGHPSGMLTVAAQVEKSGAQWNVLKATVSRSARRLMTGEVFTRD